MLHTFPKCLRQAASGLSMPHTSHQVAPDLAVAAACLVLQLGFSKTLPSPAQVIAIFRLLCSSIWVTLGRTQVLADLGLYLLKFLKASIPVRQLQTMAEHHHPINSSSDTLKGGVSGQWSPADVRPTLWDRPLHR